MTWSKEILFFQGDDFFHSVLCAMEYAQQSIQVEVYIFNFDEIGTIFHHALLSACKKGLKVQVLVDGLGARDWIEKGAAELKSAGAEVRVFHPILSLARTIQLRMPAYLLNMNRRDHRKIFIIDQKTAWVGSMNIVSDHSFKYRASQSWLDLGVQVEGDAVQHICYSFDTIWHRAQSLSQRILSFRFEPRYNFTQIMHNETRLIRSQRNHFLLNKISNAQSSILLINPYFSPTLRFLRALQNTAKIGIPVKLLLPQTSDVFFMPWIATAYYNSLLHCGVQIYEYPSQFIHAKAVIVDDWAIVGTSNLNRRSMMLDLEMDIVLFEPNNVLMLKNYFARLQKTSIKIEHEQPRLKSILGKIILFCLEPFL